MFHPCGRHALVPALIGSSMKRIFNASPRVTKGDGILWGQPLPGFTLGDKLLHPRINQSIIIVPAVNPNKRRFGSANLDARLHLRIRMISPERWSNNGTGKQ